MEKNDLLTEAQHKLEWITKRVPLDDMQEEYVGFIINQQQKMICLLSAHIYAMKGCMCMNELAQVNEFLDEAIKDIERNTGDKVFPDKVREDCKHYDCAQGRHLCCNDRLYVSMTDNRRTCDNVCIYFDEKL